MPVMNIIEAVRNALQTQMRLDSRVVVLGEDIGKFGGVFRATSGLYDEFGADRVIDTPLAEAGIIGTAIGMALYGLRPVPEIQFGDFIFPAFDQIVNELAKFRYRSGGAYTCPVVIRTPVGGGIRGGAYHSQSPEALFIHTPGLKVVAPSNPYDAKGLLLASLRQNDPVLFMEPKRIYRASRGEVPDGDFEVELGKAKIVREGTQCTVIAYSGMVSIAEEAASKADVSIEVIDLRTLLPFDIETLVASVQKTGRCVIVHEAPRTCGFGAELIASIQERAMASLEAPILRVTGFDTPFPYSLEHEYMPNADRVLSAVRQTLEW
ncbi:MAG: alpha-ketoacid dehydrogenase subunit beta [Deltaproteobacteria bacterium]|nr:alpha-ketoacid dehydrogenase subunit beta [Deltaproteobacteria bacterium]